MRQVKGPGNGMGVRHGKDECWANGGGCNVGRGRGQLVGWPLSKSTCDWIFVWFAHRKGCQRQPRKKTGKEPETKEETLGLPHWGSRMKQRPNAYMCENT